MTGVARATAALFVTLLVAGAVPREESRPRPGFAGLREGGGDVTWADVAAGVAALVFCGTLLELSLGAKATPGDRRTLRVGTAIVVAAFLGIPALAATEWTAAGLPVATLWAWTVFAFAPLWFVAFFLRRFALIGGDDEALAAVREARRREAAP